jgi:hypothetical protein
MDEHKDADHIIEIGPVEAGFVKRDEPIPELAELNRALVAFVDALAEAFHVYQIAGWINRQLDRIGIH